MNPFIDEQRLAQMNAELKRALAAGDPDILAGRFSPKRGEDAQSRAASLRETNPTPVAAE